MKNEIIAQKIRDSYYFTTTEFHEDTLVYKLGPNKYEEKLIKAIKYIIDEYTINIILHAYERPQNITLYKILEIDYKTETIVYKKIEIYLNNKFFNKLFLKDVSFKDYINDIVNKTNIKVKGTYEDLANIIVDSDIMEYNLVDFLKNQNISNIMNNL